MIEHSGDWTADGPVTRDAFLRRWLLEYLPLIRIVPFGEGQLGWLGPAELERVRHLAQPGQDPDDVPSAVLALLLGAFFLSEDGKPLRAVYGDADLAGHREWVNILKAGGDAGQLAKTFTLAANLTALAGHGLASGARRIVAATGPWILVAAGLGAAWWYLNRPASTRQRVASAAESILTGVLGAAIAYQEVQDQFTGAAPNTPDWASLAAEPPARRGPRARLPAHAGPQHWLRSLRRRADRGTALPGGRAGRGQGPPAPPRRRPVHRGLARQVAGRARCSGAAALSQHASRQRRGRVTAGPPGSPGRDGGTGDWPQNLLARVATTVGRRHQEDVASAALLYVIQADGDARRAVVADLARKAGLAMGAELPEDLFFTGQDHGEDGRPDIVGVDDSARARIVIEAKVDAGFQPGQIARYSSRMVSGLPSVLAVLAPERRLPRLLAEAARQLAAAGTATAERGPLTRQTSDRSLTLTGISWLAALEAMENVTSSPDLGQLRGYYDYLESAAFLPFAAAGLARANGR